MPRQATTTGRGQRRKMLLAPAEDLEGLRRIVEDAVNAIGATAPDLNFRSPVDAGNYRLMNLGNPAARGDAVNVRFLKDLLKELEARLTRRFTRPNLSYAWGFDDTEFEIVPGGFIIKGVDMTKAFNFDTDIFGNAVNFEIIADAISQAMMKDNSIGAAEIIAGSVATAHLTTQEIDIGYLGNNMPVRLRIRDTANNPIAWIGDDSADHGGDTNYVGAWFKRALFGGDGTMSNMQAMIDANGNFVARRVFVYSADGAIGWIGADDPVSPTYQGGWFREFYAGGTATDLPNTPLAVDSGGNLSITDATINVSATVGAVVRTVKIDPSSTVAPLDVYDANGHHSMLTGDYLRINGGTPAVGREARLYRSATSVSLHLYGSVNNSIDLTSDSDGDIHVGIGNTTLDRKFLIEVDTGSTSYADFRNMEIKVGGSTIINADTTADFGSLHIGGTAVIDASQNIVNVGTITALGKISSEASNEAGTYMESPRYDVPGYTGSTSVGIKHVTDLRWNASVLEMKTRFFDYRGGIVTNIGTESGWTTV